MRSSLAYGGVCPQPARSWDNDEMAFIADWDDAIPARTAMPTLYEGNAVTGRLRAEVAARWGARPVPVVAGGGDNAAGAAGMGIVGDGDALLSLGTSGAIFVATSAFKPNPARAR